MTRSVARFFALNLGMAALFLLAGAGLWPPPVAAQAADTITVGVASPPQTMNPHGADNDATLSIMSNIFEGLLRRNGEGKLEPALATSWKRVDALTWRFHLRKGVKFHNGNDFTWQDVKYTLKRLSDPKVSEFLAFGGLVASVKPVGDDQWTIDIKTKHPVAFFAQNLPQIFIMDKESTESRSQGEVGLKPIGTGPYRFVKWVKGSYLKLEANDQYWGEQPSIKNVVIRPITEASTRVAAIVSGQVDILQGVPVSLIKVIERNPQVKLINRPARRSIFLGMTNRPGSPTADVRVRKAMYMAINEQAIIDKVMFGHASPAAQIPDPPTIGYSKDIKRLSYDPQKAKALLKEAGYADGFEITLTGPNDRYVQDEQIEAAIANQLAKVGIKVRVDSKPKAVFFPEVDQHKLDFYLLGWFDGSYDFGRSFSKLLHTVDPKAGYGGVNGAAYSNPALDKQFAKSNKIINPKKREKALQRLNEMAMQHVAVIPLHYQENDYAVRKGHGIHFTPRADTWLVFKDMSIGGQ